MRIGIDLDGVIFDSEKLYRIYSELYDIQDLKKNSLKNNKEIRFQDRYSWSDEETNGFVKKYHRKITEVSNFMPGAKDVISLLKEEGHTLIVITARGKLNKDLIPVTIQRLKDNNLDLFEKYYWGTDNKEEICIDQLNEKYLKIKEGLLRCGNIVTNVNNEKETKEIIRNYIFLNDDENRM